jgi:hypothetical protein
MQRSTAMRLGASALAMSFAVGGVAIAASALPLKATMTPTQVVTPQGKKWKVPAAVKNARATFTGRLGTDGRTVTWQLSYSRVPGRVLADIHIGRPGKPGAFIGRLCAGCKSGQ